MINNYVVIFIHGIPMESDFLNYFLAYNYSGLDLNRWGVEVVTPILFWISGGVGLDYYDFIYLIGFFLDFPYIFFIKAYTH
ncbi:hypothetical protein C9993_11695 [Marinobacter sp. Z-F4-2]|nr:hypothetical protein C9993_11695 [Marinobacter sp. Z-F4-2]